MAGLTRTGLLRWIADHDGPHGLDLRGVDLTGLDASPGALAAEWSGDDEPPCWLVEATGGLNLAGAILAEVRLDGAHLPGADLSGADLTRAEAAGADLSGATLRGARLERAGLAHARLAGADLRGVSGERLGLADSDLSGACLASAALTGAVLHACRLTGADLHGACLEQANLYQAELRDADLSGTCLLQAELSATCLEGANLTGSALEGAALRKARAAGARLPGCHLNRADLSEADLAGAVLAGSHFDHARLEATDLRGADLSGCLFGQADLRGADLRGASLRGAQLEHADLRDADLRGASLVDARVAGADLRGADLEGAVLRGVDLDTAIRHDEQAPPPAPEFARALELDGVTTVRLDLGRGHAELVFGDDEPRIWARGLREDELEVRRAGETLELRRPAPPGETHGPVAESLAVWLPGAIRRLEARVAFGELRVRGLDAEGCLETGIGGLTVADGRFTGQASANVGSLAFERVDGGLEARTSAGDVTLVDHRDGPVTIGTGAGNIVLRGGRYEALDVHAGAGGIEYAPDDLAGEARLHAGAGGITVRLPATAAAQVEAVAGMGLISTDWPLVRVGRPGPATNASNRMVGAFGAESERVRLELRTGVGDIHLRRQSGAPTETVPEPAGHLAVLESLSRGELTVAEAEALLYGEGDA